LLGATVATFFAVQAKREAGAKDQERREAVRQRDEADRQSWRAERLVFEKEQQRQQAEAETRRVKSVLKAALLLRVELVGYWEPRAAFLLLRDEEIYP